MEDVCVLRSFETVQRWFEFLGSKKQGDLNVSFTILLIRVVMKAAFVLEPLIPALAAFILNRQMNSWERQGLILDHTVRIERLGRFYYKIDVRLVLTSKQLGKILGHLVKML